MSKSDPHEIYMAVHEILHDEFSENDAYLRQAILNGVETGGNPKVDILIAQVKAKLAPQKKE